MGAPLRRRTKALAGAQTVALHLQATVHAESTAACVPHVSRQAEEGKLDPVVGRKKEIERVTQVRLAARLC